MRAAQRKLLLPVLLLSALIPLLILWQSGTHGLTGFPLDDAWIHLVYGRSIAENGYLAYNTGIPSTGSTSPLWAYILGVAHLLFSKTGAVILAAKFFGLFFHVLMTYYGFKIISAATNSGLAGGLSALILGLSPFLAVSSLSGMEISLGCALCSAGIWAYLQGRYWQAGLFLGLSGLTRPEYALVICVVIIDLLLRVQQKKIPFSKFLILAIPVILMAGLFLGWNLYVDGRLFPATYYVKAIPRGGLPFLDRLVYGFMIISSASPLKWGIVWLGALGVLTVRREARRTALLLLFSGMAYLLGNLILIPPSDPEAFYHIRYLLPSVPLFFTGLAIIFASASMALFANIRKWLFHSVLALLLIFFLATTVSGLKFWTIKYTRDCRNINEVQVALGNAVSCAFSREARIGTIDAGAVRYFGKRYTYDLMGLNTKILTNFACQDNVLEALVLMPAWMRLPSPHGLVPILVKQTKDYHVTSNPRMNCQVIVVCRSESNATLQEMRLLILGRSINVCLRCVGDGEMEYLNKLLDNHGLT